MRKDEYVFLSYSSKDIEVAKQVKKMLQKAGISCWIAVDEIPCGGDYAEYIVPTLSSEKCVAFVLLLSKASQESEHVLREVRIAENSRVPIYPILLDLVEADFNSKYIYIMQTKQYYAVDKLPVLVKELKEKYGAAKSIDEPKRKRSKSVSTKLDEVEKEDSLPEEIFENVDTADTRLVKRIIVATMGKFKIPCEVVNVLQGATVTRYDVSILDSSKTKRSLNCKEAIALALRQKGVDIYLNYSLGVLSVEVPNANATQPDERDEAPGAEDKRDDGYVRPPYELLNDYPANYTPSTEEVEENKRAILNALKMSGVSCTVVGVTVGHFYTRYDLNVVDPTKIKRALSCSDAVAMAVKDQTELYLNYPLGVLSVDVANKIRNLVGLKSVIGSPEFANGGANKLKFAIGKDIDNRSVYGDITQLPHLLVGGTTGSGKSIFINTLLVSLLYKYSPQDLRIILIDPKYVELVQYENLPHLLKSTNICSVDEASRALRWAIEEMERRYSLFREASASGSVASNFETYNAKVTDADKRLPRILIVVDELGDLMLQQKKLFEMLFVRLLQKARACGIHLILTTQRPSVDCVPELIRNNISSRVAFKTISAFESNVVLGQGGAEKLTGRGDMFFKQWQDIRRVQSCYISPEEIQRVVDFIKANNKSSYSDKFLYYIQPSATVEIATAGGREGVEAIYLQALKYCIASNQASASLLQRRFCLGYTRACKIIDWMEEKNFISGAEGSKARKVLITMDEFIQRFGDLED